jgi:hypothetical protein
MSQLGKEHRHDMTPRGVGTSFVVDTAFAAQLRDQMSWNIIAKLPENGELAGGWFGSVFIFFHTTPCGVAKAFRPAFSSPVVGRL